MLPRVLLIAACLLHMVLAQQPVTAVNEIRNITYVGYKSNGVEHFQGIKYGKDTSGDNRFKHPQAFTYPNGTMVQVTSAGPSCPQQTTQSFFGFTQNQGVYNMSEDCLNLRIARAAGTKQDANLAVMVWIYGGGDETGSANYSLYDPTQLVLGADAKGTPLVYVAMNYRLNIFGFAHSPALRAERSLNAGILDQRLALEWIQKNIATFGGNPKNVTLFGQSDGATGVGLQMTAYGGNGSVPFHRGILQSGSPTGDPGVSGNFTINSTATVAGLAGCSDTNSSKVLGCLRKLTMPKLLDAVLKYENMTANLTNQDIFFPTVDGDFIPKPPSELLRTGQFHKNISVIAGWAYNNGSIFTSPTLTNALGVEAFVQASYPHLNASTIDTLLSLYDIDDFTATASNVSISPYFLQAAQIYRDVNFACPAINIANYVAQYAGESYLYDLNATSFDTLLLLANASFEGVIHISDVPFVFNNANIGLGITQAQQAVQNAMSGSWARFVVTGNPSGGAPNGFAGWTKAYNSTQEAVRDASRQASVRVIGGANAGQHSLTNDSTSSIETKLLNRCIFISSASFYHQVET